MNHGVSEKHKIHAGASDTLIILLQIHLESFFKAFEGWDLKDWKNEKSKTNDGNTKTALAKEITTILVTTWKES